MHAAYGIGAATSPLIVTVVVSSGTSWRWAYLLVMIIQGLLAVLFAVSARRWDGAAAPRQGASPAPATSSPGSLDGPRRRPPPRAVVGLLLAAVDCGLESVVGLWAFVFLLEAVTLEPSIAGLVVSGYWAALVIGRVLLGSVAERVGTWPVLAAATITAISAAGLVMTRQPIPTAVGLVLLGLAVAPIYPLLVLTTAARTAANSVDRLVGFQAAASTLGSVTFASVVGILMGAEVSSFAYCVLALAVLTSAGIWALRPGQHSPTRSPH
jgi:predicted MFS family arabinose efflux permease